MEKILVPCDFSKPASEAFKFALEIADLTKSEVIVLHVIDIPLIYETTFGVNPYVFENATRQEMIGLANQNFEKMKEDIKSSLKEVKVSFHLEQGGVTSMIYEFINKSKIDLVVMATQGAGGFKDFILGSTTEKIIRLSPVPVVTVKNSFDTSSIQNIIFPTNLEIGQDELVERVKEVQKLFNATIHILFVNTPGNFERDKEINKKLEHFAQHFNFQDFTLNIRNDIYEEFGIISFAQEINADLIVMSTHGRRGIAHLVIGSIAEDVLKNVDCAVLTYKIKK